jgi:carboxyl-terminal processing protease
MVENRTARAFLIAGLITLGLLVAFGAGIGTTYLLMREGVAPGPSAAGAAGQAGGSGDDVSLFWEAWDLVEQHFFGDLPDNEHLSWGLIRGGLATLDDPHTVFIEPQPRQREKEALSGRFGGIGASVTKTEDGRIVLDPQPDLPAIEAGVLKGDTLLKVDDTEITPEMSVDDVVSLIRGEIGTPVTLTVRHEGQTEPAVITVTRAEIPSPTVEWRMLDGTPGAGYARITMFSDRTPSELSNAIGDLKKQGMTRLVLDLRGNGGGLLDSGIKVAGEFLDGGPVVIQAEKGGKEHTYEAGSSPSFAEGKVVVLVDGGTASASEIVAGALQDRGRAVLVGEQTYGKGSVQQVFDLSDGSSVHITFADWLTPNRRKITGTGLTPEVQIAITDDDRAQGKDPQLERAIQVLEEK